MSSIYELEKAKTKAKQDYETANEKMQSSVNDPSSFHSAAQFANDMWLKLKDAEFELSNGLIIHQRHDLYGC